MEIENVAGSCCCGPKQKQKNDADLIERQWSEKEVATKQTSEEAVLTEMISLLCVLFGIA